MCSLIESLSTLGLQSLLAECLYLKGLPEESSHLARYSDGSQITAAGGFLSTLQHQKTSCMDWIVMATGLGLKRLKWKDDGREKELPDGLYVDSVFRKIQMPSLLGSCLFKSYSKL